MAGEKKLPSQEKLRTMLMQNFGGRAWGQIRCIMGDVQVSYRKSH